MLKYATLSAAFLMASSTFVLADKANENQGVGGANPPSQTEMDKPAASDKSPGQMKANGSSAKELAPGQVKGARESAKDDAPGQAKESKSSAKDEAPGQKKLDAKDEDESTKSGSNADDAGSKSGKAGTDKDDGKKLAEIPAEKKTEVRKAFSHHRVEPVKNLNIAINVGVSVPHSVRLYAVPEDIVVIYPAYRSYRYFLVDDRICIVDPDTFEIVEVIVVA